MFNKDPESPKPFKTPKPSPVSTPASSDSDVEKIKAWKPGSKVRLEGVDASRYMELKNMFKDNNCECEFVHYEENKVLVVK